MSDTKKLKKSLLGMHRRLDAKRLELNAVIAIIQAEAQSGREQPWTPEREIRSREYTQLLVEIETLETSVQSVARQVETRQSRNREPFVRAGILPAQK